MLEPGIAVFLGECFGNMMLDSPPGETIKDILKERGISVFTFACKMQMNKKSVRLLLSGVIPIDEEIAIKLSEVLGSTALFWMNREKNYRNAIQEE